MLRPAVLVHDGKRYPLAQGLTMLGRDAGRCDVAFDDPDLSLEHLIISRDGDRYVAIDFKSSFGVKVNGANIDRVRLRNGDLIQIGAQTIQFEQSDRRPRDAAPGRDGVEAGEDQSLTQALSAGAPEGSAGAGVTSLATSTLAVKLANLIRVGRVLNSELNLDLLLYKLIDSSISVVAADRGMILLVNAETGKLDPWLYRTTGAARQESEGPLQISRKIAESTAASREPVLSPDALDDRRFRAVEGDSSIEVHNIRSAICVPLLHHETLLGVLYVDTQLGGIRFSEQDLELLTAFADQAAIALENARLYRLAYTDELTSCYVRRYFDRRLREELERVASHGGSVTVLLLDIDHFKKVNDTYGHASGDAVLKQVSAVIRESVRNIDVVARYGGEEFVVMLPDQNLTEGAVPAERIRAAVEAATLHAGEHTIRCTVSIGLATCPGKAREPAALVKSADEALYRAKHGGRNQIRSTED